MIAAQRNNEPGRPSISTWLTGPLTSRHLGFFKYVFQKEKTLSAIVYFTIT